MTKRFTMRIEVWEKDPNTNEIFDEYCYDEVYYRNNNKYYKFLKNRNLIEIENPFKNRLNLKEFNKTCRRIYNNNQNIGTFIPEKEILSSNGYPIDGIDIIFKEEGVFQYSYIYDNGKKLDKDLYKIIDEL